LKLIKRYLYTFQMARKRLLVCEIKIYVRCNFTVTYLMLCSRRRSDQLDRIKSPMKPDQAGLNAHSRLLHDFKSTLHDVLRLLLDDNPTNIPTSRAPRPIHESYTISTRLTGPLLDRFHISTRPDRNYRNRVVNSRV
jgi:hypothetical protein